MDDDYQRHNKIKYYNILINIASSILNDEDFHCF